MSELLNELSRLESELHHPGARLDEARLQALLHAGFHEVGRSGRAYDRATVLRFLVARAASAEGPPDVVPDQFAVHVLGRASALLTYRAAHRQPDGTLTRHTLRSSVWRLEAGGWQLFYHQGTPAEVPW